MPLGLPPLGPPPLVALLMRRRPPVPVGGPAPSGGSVNPILPTDPGFAFIARSRSARALVIVTPAVAPPP